MYSKVIKASPLAGNDVLLTLDGYRGIAALAVALRHASDLWPGGTPRGLLFESYLAVDLFFILSGFVLAHAYADALRHRMTAGRFALLRLIRIYPLYLLSIAISVAFDVSQRAYHGETSLVTWDLLRALLMVPNTTVPNGYVFPLNPPAWTLLLEVVVSLCFGASRILRTPATLLPGVLVAAAGLAAIAVAHPGAAGDGALDAGFVWGTADVGALRVAYGFFAGVLLRLVWRRLPAAPRVPAWLLAGLVALALAAPPLPAAQLLFDLGAVFVVFPVLIWLGAVNPPGPRLAPAMAWVGAISYAVYVLQFPLYSIGGPFLAKTGIAAFVGAPVLLGLAQVAVVVAVSAVLTAKFDVPVRRTLRSLLDAGVGASPTGSAR